MRVACMAGGGMCMAGEMATEAGGTHPTEMHSFFSKLKTNVAQTSYVAIQKL